MHDLCEAAADENITSEQIKARDNIDSTVKDYAELNPNSAVRNIFDKLDAQ